MIDEKRDAKLDLRDEKESQLTLSALDDDGTTTDRFYCFFFQFFSLLSRKTDFP